MASFLTAARVFVLYIAGTSLSRAVPTSSRSVHTFVGPDGALTRSLVGAAPSENATATHGSMGTPQSATATDRSVSAFDPPGRASPASAGPAGALPQSRAGTVASQNATARGAVAVDSAGRVVPASPELHAAALAASEERSQQPARPGYFGTQQQPGHYGQQYAPQQQGHYGQQYSPPGYYPSPQMSAPPVGYPTGSHPAAVGLSYGAASMPAATSCDVPMWEKEKYVCEEYKNYLGAPDTWTDMAGNKRVKMPDAAKCTVVTPEFWMNTPVESIVCTAGKWMDKGQPVTAIECTTSPYFTAACVIFGLGLAYAIYMLKFKQDSGLYAWWHGEKPVGDDAYYAQEDDAFAERQQ